MQPARRGELIHQQWTRSAIILPFAYLALTSSAGVSLADSRATLARSAGPRSAPLAAQLHGSFAAAAGASRKLGDANLGRIMRIGRESNALVIYARRCV